MRAFGVFWRLWLKPMRYHAVRSTVMFSFAFIGRARAGKDDVDIKIVLASLFSTSRVLDGVVFVKRFLRKHSFPFCW